jgi:hypothetical protein
MDELTYRRLKELARESGRKPAALVREAVAEYTARHSRRRRPKSVGSFRSGRHDLGGRAEDLLRGFGDDR